MNQTTKEILRHASMIIVSAVVSELLHEGITEYRRRRYDKSKNPVGFIQNN